MTKHNDTPPTIAKSFAALQRAALQARLTAQQTGTDLIISRDGAVVHLSPDSLSKADDSALTAATH